MATTIVNGVITEFKIGQDEPVDSLEPATVAVISPEVVAAKLALKLAKDALKIAKGEPVGKRGKPKQYHFERKMVSAQIPLDDYNSLMEHFKTPTEAINAVVAQYLQSKADEADQDVNAVG